MPSLYAKAVLLVISSYAQEEIIKVFSKKEKVPRDLVKKAFFVHFYQINQKLENELHEMISLKDKSIEPLLVPIFSAWLYCQFVSRNVRWTPHYRFF